MSTKTQTVPVVLTDQGTQTDPLAIIEVTESDTESIQESDVDLFNEESNHSIQCPPFSQLQMWNNYWTWSWNELICSLHE